MRRRSDILLRAGLSTGLVIFLWALAAVGSKLPHDIDEDEFPQKTIANQCPENSPWPCREPGWCLSFDFICDGERDCPDGYDEDREMCTAKQRPPVEYLTGFIKKYRDWLIPDFLGNGTPQELAAKLVESPSLKEYVVSAKLTDSQYRNLELFIEGVIQRKEMQLVLLGMPLGAWSELFYLFNRIVNSGFAGPLVE